MTTPTLTCEHCDSEIDVEKDPKCVVYDPSGQTDVMCSECRKIAYDRWYKSAMGGTPIEMPRIKRGWRA